MRRQVFLKLAVFRYLDKFFGLDRLYRAFCLVLRICVSVDRKGSTVHALECLEMLVKLLLGPDAIAKDKSSCGPKLVILDVEIELAACGFWLRPESKKAD